MPCHPSQIPAIVLHQIPAMVAYWDAQQKCVFSNEAYREWFGVGPEQMAGMTLKELLGPLYEKNLSHILGALAGRKQLFERQIPLPDGELREVIATYTPDIMNGEVRGFAVVVTDVTILRARERALEELIRERDEAVAEVQTLRGLLPICAGCKSIRDGKEKWISIEEYVSQRTEARFSHGLCPRCADAYFPGIDISPKE